MFYIQANDKANNPPSFKGSTEKPLEIKVTRLDQEPPQIVHTPIEKVEGKSLIDINAIVTDNVGVDYVRLFYRSAGEQKYKMVNMKQSGNNYNYSLDIGKIGIEYFIQAKDISGNEPSFWKGPDKPQLTSVLVEKQEENVVKTKKKSSKKLLLIGIGGALLGGGILAALASGGGSETTNTSETDSRLPDPPSGP